MNEMIKLRGKEIIYLIPFICFVIIGLANTVIGLRQNLRILGLFPHPGESHFYFFKPILRALAERGHHVTVVSNFPDKNPPIGYHDITIISSEEVKKSFDIKANSKNLGSHHFSRYLSAFFFQKEWGIKICNETLRSRALDQVLYQKNRYDIILVEQFNTDCMVGVAHVLKAPVIAMSSSYMLPWHFERTGTPILPSYMPNIFLDLSEDMSFSDRLVNWFIFHNMIWLYKYYTIPATDEILRFKFGNNLPSVSELVKNISVFFVNQHYSLHSSMSLPPSVIELGGLHIQKPQPIDMDLQKFIENAEHGVILISWGSLIRADTMPVIKRDSITKAIRRLKQRVIWKWENDTLIDKPDNLYISKWLPQRDILCHPKVKVFMTHSGLLGSTEAVYCGVPVVATPMFGDQFFNAAGLKHRGMGIILSYNDINENNVIKSIKKILEPQYAENAKRVSYAYRHRPQTALETALWWVEYVAATDGAPLLKSPAVYMSRFTYYLLDIYLIIGSIIIIIIGTIILICRRIFFKKNAKINKTKIN